MKGRISKQTAIGREGVLPSLRQPVAPNALDGSLDIPPVPVANIAREVFEGVRGTILQVPVGDGRTTAYLANRLQFITGVDSPLAIDQARNLIEQLGLWGSCNLVPAEDLSSLQIADGQCAGAFSAGLLSHLHGPDRVLKEMLRICRPGSPLVLEFMAPGDSTGQTLGAKKGDFDKWAVEGILGAVGIPSPWRIERVAWKGPSEGRGRAPLQRVSWVVTAHKAFTR